MADSGPRRTAWAPWTALVAGYAIGGVIAHALTPHLPTLTLTAYAVADVGGLVFIVRYLRTDWRAHPWGRHVMAFMVCLEVLFTLALSRRIFGQWPGLLEVGFLASATFAGIVWWRAWLQYTGERAARSARTSRTVPPATAPVHPRYGAQGRPDVDPWDD